MYLTKSVSGYRAHSCYKAQLALALFRVAGLREAMADMEDARAPMAEARKLYADIVPSENRRGSELTEELLVAAVPLSSR
jgi:hypothetical protein